MSSLLSLLKSLQLLILLKDNKRISITCDKDNPWLYYCLCYLEITINNNKVIQSGRKNSIVGLGPWKVVENADAIVVFSLNKGKYNDINIVELENEYNIEKAKIDENDTYVMT